MYMYVITIHYIFRPIKMNHYYFPSFLEFHIYLYKTLFPPLHHKNILQNVSDTRNTHFVLTVFDAKGENAKYSNPSLVFIYIYTSTETWTETD